MNTIHTSSLTHEIESYGSRADLLAFIRNRYEELAPGGVWINRDVVGPYNKEKIVLMRLNGDDGRNTDYEKRITDRAALAQYLTGLSTKGRFLRFAMDFRKKEGYVLNYNWVTVNGDEYVRIALKDACEFMSRKDYIDNWESEMHETFCFWDFDEWKDHLKDVGFAIDERSGAYTNKWIVENRWEGRVTLLSDESDPQILKYPQTNMISIAVKK
jgi:hypothetical protein